MISVITVTYNNHDELLATMDSLSGVKSIERIVINGGSDPHTLEWLNENSQIRSISEPDHGISDAFTKGAKLATGTAIAYLNSGDILLDKNYYQRSLEFLEDHNDIAFTHSNFIFIDQIAGPLLMKPTMAPIGAGMPYFHPTMVVKKEVFDLIGYFDLSYKIAMDYDFVCRMTKANLKGYYLNQKPVIKMDGSGISARNEKKALTECYRSLESNNLFSFKQRFFFIKRYLTFQMRSLLARLGFSNLLRTIKKIKHRHERF